MCGIVGIVAGPGFAAKSAALEGLHRLEYRGYDSAGLVLLDSELRVFKKAGRVAQLEAHVPKDLEASTALAHTRWATHGGVTDANAHPHLDCAGQVAVVHNGIIENFAELKRGLAARGHRFRSETDTEVFAHLVEEHLKAAKSLPQAVREAAKQVQGSYSFGVLWAKEPGTLVGLRRYSPLVVGVGRGVSFLASDVPAVLKHTRQVVFLDDGDVAVLTPTSVVVTDLDGKPLDRRPQEVAWTLDDAQRAGYDHFMLKEIHETPRAISETLFGRTSLTAPFVTLAEIPDALLRDAERVVFVAAGTSMHAAMVGRWLFEDVAKTPAKVEASSEYRYAPALHEPGTLVVGLTQSGETADTMMALRGAKERGAPCVALTNVIGSSVTRLADATVYTRAGPEIGVAATKTFVAQLAALHLVALRTAEVKGTQSGERVRGLVNALRYAPRLCQNVLADVAPLRQAAEELSRAHSCFFLGRGVNHPVALEGALKMKEISYVHAEGYAGGELKHGPFALLTPETPVVAFLAADHVREKMVSNVIEVKARGPRVTCLAPEDDGEIGQVADTVLAMPRCDPLLSPFPHAVASFLLAYYAAKALGRDIDKPRNLAKSVTVE